MEISEEVKKATRDRDPTYFQYYAQLVHQQNMLQDNVRTSMYYASIINNPLLFKDKIVMDLGAGSGILSYFSVQAGAAHVFAVEASNMSFKIQKLISASGKNPYLANKITTIHSKIEDCTDLPMVDTIVSEPIGVFLVHERMLESYLYARDNFLKPDGRMVPSSGTIFLSPFTDSTLWNQTMVKARFWEQSNFYGVDLSPLAKDAIDEIFGQPVVGGFDDKQLMASTCNFTVDFETAKIEELQEFTIPFSFVMNYTGIVHGIASWFDIDLSGYILSTAPHLERTHWHQVRLLLKEPLAVNANQSIRGWLHFKVNGMRSYDVTLELVLGLEGEMFDYNSRGKKDGQVRRSSMYSLHEQCYFFDSYSMPENAKPEQYGLYEPPTQEI